MSELKTELRNTALWTLVVFHLANYVALGLFIILK